MPLRENKPEQEEHFCLLSEELSRVQAEAVQVSLDDCFEPQAGVLLKVEIGSSFWRLWPEEFRSLLREIPDGAGSGAVQRAMEQHAMHDWRRRSASRTRELSK
jgi:hypothetical protein